MLGATQIRIARPTVRLAAITQFYTGGLGMEILGQFSGHAGYDGVMLGMPDKRMHLEFTSHEDLKQEDLPKPTKEHLLVFYFDTPSVYFEVINRLQEMGCRAVVPENPYWEGKSETYEDPDGWRIVLFNGQYA